MTLNFAAFKAVACRRVATELGVDLKACQSWSDFTARLQPFYHLDRHRPSTGHEHAELEAALGDMPGRLKALDEHEWRARGRDILDGWHRLDAMMARWDITPSVVEVPGPEGGNIGQMRGFEVKKAREKWKSGICSANVRCPQSTFTQTNRRTSKTICTCRPASDASCNCRR